MQFKLKVVSGLAAALVLASTPGRAAGRLSILFIGNSFTMGTGSDVDRYHSGTVTDLNHEGIGGVPALFKAFADEAGLAYDVALETRGGAGIDFHLQNSKAEIAGRAWDVVVAQGYSTLDQEKPRDAAKLIATSRALADLVRARNPKVELFLTSTWSRPDQVYPATGAWAGEPIQRMARDIRAAYDRAAAGARAKVVPVGEAFNRAVSIGLADGNPYDGIDTGKLDLWTFDQYHASTYGYYLEALVVFGRVTGRDPRSLGGAERAARELGIAQAVARALQQIAFEELRSARINRSAD
jgi:hypothetical protein